MNSVKSVVLVFILFTVSEGNCLDTVFDEIIPDYQFLTHPSPNISCDPYANGGDSSLILECSALRTGTKNEPVQIVWFRTLTSQGTTDNLNELAQNTTGIVQIEETFIIPGSATSFNLMRSTLTINRVMNSEGTYWCALQKDNQPQELLQVNMNVPRFDLKPPSCYDGRVGCPENAIHAVLGSTFSSSSSISSSSSSSSSTTPSQSPPSSPLSTKFMDVKSRKKKTITTTTSVESGSLLFNLSFLDLKGLVIISVVFGTLLCVLLVLLICVLCMCCQRKRKRAKRMTKVESFQSTASLVLSRETPTMPHVISPIPMTTTISSVLSTSSPVLTGIPPKHPPPKMKKMPPLPPQHSTMPKSLSHKISSSEIDAEMEQNIEARRAKRAATEQPSLNNLTGKLPIPTSYFAGTTGVEAQNYLRQDSSIQEDSCSMVEDNIYAAPFSDCVGTMTPSNSAMGSTIRLNNLVNTSLPTCQDLNEDDIFADEGERKYKSLNRFTMDNHPLYDDPSQIYIDAEDNDEENAEQNDSKYASYDPKHSALSFARHLDIPSGHGLGAEVRESMDGEYVIPNDVLRTPIDFLQAENNVESDDEPPEYIIVT